MKPLHVVYAVLAFTFLTAERCNGYDPDNPNKVRDQSDDTGALRDPDPGNGADPDSGDNATPSNNACPPQQPVFGGWNTNGGDVSGQSFLEQWTMCKGPSGWEGYRTFVFYDANVSRDPVCAYSAPFTAVPDAEVTPCPGCDHAGQVTFGPVVDLGGNSCAGNPGFDYVTQYGLGDERVAVDPANPAAPMLMFNIAPEFWIQMVDPTYASATYNSTLTDPQVQGFSWKLDVSADFPPY